VGEDDLEGVAVTVTEDVADIDLDGVGDDVGDRDTLDDLVGVPDAEFEGVAEEEARLDNVALGDFEALDDLVGVGEALDDGDPDLVDVVVNV